MYTNVHQNIFASWAPSLNAGYKNENMRIKQDKSLYAGIIYQIETSHLIWISILQRDFMSHACQQL